MIYSKLREPSEYLGLLDCIFCGGGGANQKGTSGGGDAATVENLLGNIDSWVWVFHPELIRARQELFYQDLDQICNQWKRGEGDANELVFHQNYSNSHVQSL